jgi:hypothetical protein
VILLKFQQLSELQSTLYERIDSIKERLKYIDMLKINLRNEYQYGQITRYNYEHKIKLLNLVKLELDFILDSVNEFHKRKVDDFINEPIHN